jgi:hypothetical protein
MEKLINEYADVQAEAVLKIEQEKDGIRLYLLSENLKYECEQYEELEDKYPMVFRAVEKILYLLTTPIGDNPKKALHKITVVMEKMADLIYEEKAYLETCIVDLENEDIN